MPYDVTFTYMDGASPKRQVFTGLTLERAWQCVTAGAEEAAATGITDYAFTIESYTP